MFGKIVCEIVVGVEMVAGGVVAVDLREEGAVVSVVDEGVVREGELGVLAAGVVLVAEGDVVGECFG